MRRDASDNNKFFFMNSFSCFVPGDWRRKVTVSLKWVFFLGTQSQHRNTSEFNTLECVAYNVYYFKRFDHVYCYIRPFSQEEKNKHSLSTKREIIVETNSHDRPPSQNLDDTIYVIFLYREIRNKKETIYYMYNPLAKIGIVMVVV